MRELTTYEPADIEIYLKGKGMVLKEKSLVAFTPSDGKILAIGNEAEEIARENREGVLVISPLRRGMVADFSVAVKMFKYMTEKVWGKKLFRRPSIVVCAPNGMTEVDEVALKDILCLVSFNHKIITFSEGALEQFMEGMRVRDVKRYTTYDLFIAITKNEPEKYISDGLSDILDYAVREGIPIARVEELLKAEEELCQCLRE